MISTVQCQQPDASLTLDSEQSSELQDLTLELKYMHRYLDQLQLKLNLQVPQCPPRVLTHCQDINWLKLYGSQQPDIQLMQAQTQGLQHQMKSLQCCSRVGNSCLDKAQKEYDDLKREFRQIKCKYNGIHSIRLYLDQEAGRCLQRYRYGLQLFANWSEIYQSGSDLQAVYRMCLLRMCEKVVFREQKRLARQELGLATAVCNATIQQALQRVRDLEQQMEICGGQETRSLMWFVMKHKRYCQGGGNEDQQKRQLRFTRRRSAELLLVMPSGYTWYGRMQQMIQGIKSKRG